MDIDLTIDSLVLQGFPSTDRVQISAAVQQELTRLLAEQGIPPSLSQGSINLPTIDGGQFDWAPGTHANTVGCQIAQQIYASLG
ncbi:MAG: hypothetical protein AAF921_02710 [Cyanobacteria bacterium P01_D01_bin.44]